MITYFKGKKKTSGRFQSSWCTGKLEDGSPEGLVSKAIIFYKLTNKQNSSTFECHRFWGINEDKKDGERKRRKNPSLALLHPVPKGYTVLKKLCIACCGFIRIGQDYKWKVTFFSLMVLKNRPLSIQKWLLLLPCIQNQSQGIWFFHYVSRILKKKKKVEKLSF